MTNQNLGQCKLCKKTGVTLMESHFMSKALYKVIMKHEADPAPLVLLGGKSLSTSRQVTQPLLCSHCEDLFNKNGEKYVLGILDRGKDGFRLQEILKGEQAICPGKPYLVYEGSKIPAIDMNKLVYFAGSIFWRAAVKSWEFMGGQYQMLSIGPYEEKLRQYLLGNFNFPVDASLQVWVTGCKDGLTGFIFPYFRRKISFHREYRFIVPGLLFVLSLGKRISDNHREICSYHSQEKFIIMSDRVNAEIKHIFSESIPKKTT